MGNTSADLSSLTAKSGADNRAIGENVEVVRGEMKDSTSKVSSLENGIATVITQVGALKFNILNGIVTLLSDSTLKKSSFGDGPGRFAGGRGPWSGRDPLISKTVTITGGPYKGYIGIVMDVTSNGTH
ncbi:hypothetical protein HK405_014603, partial [Cladochytrium tenue]